MHVWFPGVMISWDVINKDEQFPVLNQEEDENKSVYYLSA